MKINLVETILYLRT